MSKFLRTTSTRRLLATLTGLLAAIAAGTAIAVAAGANGPVPPARPLAVAIHDALSAPRVQGISARISFTNHLIDSSSIQGVDPLLSGATGRLWLSSDHQLRLELQGDNGDAQIVFNKGYLWVYDPTSNTVYEGNLPSIGGDLPGARDLQSGAQDQIPSIAQIQSDLNKLAQHLDLSGAIPGDVAGQAAYTIRISPKHDGGLLGAAEFAWDAIRGVPLRIAVYARGDSSPVLELKVTDISYGPVPSSDFAIRPPLGAKVVKFTAPTGAAAAWRGDRHHAVVTGIAAVARRLPFKLVAPSVLPNVGLPRRSVALLDWGGTPAALVAYGQGIGGVAVIEQVANTGGGPIAALGGGHAGLSLPTVSINGATGQELDTALGTMISFTRGGVTYTVAGSVPPAAAELAARGL